MNVDPLQKHRLSAPSIVATDQTLPTIAEHATHALVNGEAHSNPGDLFKVYSSIASAPLYSGDAIRRY